MNKPSQKNPQNNRKYEIRERYFHLEPLVTDPTLIELPKSEMIIGTTIYPEPTGLTKLLVITAKDVTNAD